MTNLGAMIRRDIPPNEVVSHAQLVQEGFDELWVVEDLPYAGGISQAMAVLDATDDVVVGHGIAPAPFRNPAALAMEWAAMAEFHPGRVACGVGHGVQPWMRQVGEAVDSPLSLLRETVSAVKQLLAGETVDVTGQYVQLQGVKLQFPPSVVPLVSAGVLGPKSLELAGAVADGTVLPEGQGPDQIEAALESINAGRSVSDGGQSHRLTVFVGYYCGDPSGLGPPPADAPSGWEAIGATPVEVAGQLQQLVAAGADSLILVPFGTDMVGQLQLAANEIVPLVSRRLGASE